MQPDLGHDIPDIYNITDIDKFVFQSLVFLSLTLQDSGWAESDQKDFILGISNVEIYAFVNLLMHPEGVSQDSLIDPVLKEPYNGFIRNGVVVSALNNRLNEKGNIIRYRKKYFLQLF